jgi:hypothetical protein
MISPLRSFPIRRQSASFGTLQAFEKLTSHSIKGKRTFARRQHGWLYMCDGELLTINAPKDAVSVYWDNNLKILNSFDEITVVTFPPSLSG